MDLKILRTPKHQCSFAFSCHISTQATNIDVKTKIRWCYHMVLIDCKKFIEKLEIGISLLHPVVLVS